MTFIAELYHKVLSLVRELLKFGTVGAVGWLVQTGVSNLLWHAVGAGPLTGSVVATVVATIVTYAGNRYWTFRHRDQSGLAREYFLFFVLNGIGLLIQLLFLGFTVYTLKLDGPLARNLSNNVFGVAFATLFRYWSYKKWVFLPPSAPQVDPHTGLPEADREVETASGPNPNGTASNGAGQHDRRPRSTPRDEPRTATLRGRGNGSGPEY